MQTPTEALRRLRFRNRLMRASLTERRARDLTAADRVLVSYPRSGTTWVRFLLYELVTGTEAEFGRVGARIPYVGRHRHTPPSLRSGGRLVFTHDLPTRNAAPSIVYLVRDPRSVVLSEYRWQQRRRVAPGPFDRFVRDFVDGRTNAWGSWDAHVTAWLASPAAETDRCLVVRFEDLRADPERQVRALANFLGIDASDAAIERAVENNRLERMREKEDGGVILADSRNDVRFVASGAVDAWQQQLDPELAENISAAFTANLDRLGYAADRR
jgi:hypothetical protein